MTSRFALPVALLCLAAGPVLAESHAPTAADLYATMRLGEIIAVMREEGLASGGEIAADLFDGATPAEWTGLIDAIYDTDRMEAEVGAALASGLAGRDIAPMIAFFDAEPGQTFLALEISARRALLDDAVEQAAKEAAAVAIADQTDRFRLIERYVLANDLIESNVVSAMNSNIAYFLGMMQGGAMPTDLSEEQILSNVWGQEPEIRADTTEWVYSFLLMAYDPVPDADIEAYVAFSETEAGQALNSAMFAAFDGMFGNISHALGEVTAQFLVTQEL